MATTTNYGWTTPDDTALVKDGASAIRTLGSSVDTTTKNLNPETTLGDISFRSSTSDVNTRLAIGSSGQHLTVVAGVPAWATASDQTPLTTKGDLFTFSTVDARLPIGTDTYILTADSAEATGIKWAAPAASSGPAFLAYRSSDTSFVNGVWTKTPFNAESFDTDSCFDSTTNYRFTPSKAGYYNIQTQVRLSPNTGIWAQLKLYKNGSAVRAAVEEPSTSNKCMPISTLIYMNGSSDYLEVYYYIEGSGNLKGDSTEFPTWFDGVWIRS